MDEGIGRKNLGWRFVRGIWGADPGGGGGGARGQIGDLEEPLIARHHFFSVQLYLMLLILVC